MKKRPRAAFVVTTTLAALAAFGCHKEDGSSGECKPPDCHINPPPNPPEPIHDNPPPMRVDAGALAADAAPPSTPLAK